MAIPARAATQAALNISYETEHCLVRELDPSDASDVICGWMSDPDVARALNAPARAISMDELHRYIAQHDRVTGHLLGVYRKQDGALIGLWSVYVDWQYREFLVNVLIPGKIEGELGALKETGRPLYDIFFDDLGLEVMCYNVLESNRNVLDRPASNIPPEHATTVASASGSGAETINHFRMTREVYCDMRARREERDAVWREARKARREGGA